MADCALTTSEATLWRLVHSHASVPPVKLLQQLGIQLERIEGHRIRSSEQVGKPQQQKHVALANLLTVQRRPIRGKEQPFINLASGS